MRTYLKKRPKCKCGKDMILDDIDYNFEGNQDEYWVCPDSCEGIIVKIRYGKVVKIL